MARTGVAAVRRGAERAAVWVLAALLVAASAAVWYFGTPLHGDPASVEAVREDPAVALERGDGAYALRPAGEPADAGLVFYPGGRVHPDAYLAALAPIAREAGVAVFLPRVPLSLAVLDPDAAGRIMARERDVGAWYVGGHSLGGVVACRFARDAGVRGLVLFASYCDVDVSDRPLRVLSVTGTADAVLDRSAYRRNRDHLPPGARLAAIEGMNHSQFGSYTGQRGGRPASIPYREAHDRLAGIAVPWFENGSRTAR